MVRSGISSYWRELSLVLASSILPIFVAVKLNGQIAAMRDELEMARLGKR